MNPAGTKPGSNDSESTATEEARTVARGRATRTPFVALGAVAATAWLVAGAIVLGIFLLIWLL